jgi:hypothetical protein
MPRNEKKIILVVGDFMVDREWILSGQSLSTVQAHDDIKPMRRIHPGWKYERLGGAGMTLMALKALSEKYYSDKFYFYGVGLWNETDDILFGELAGVEWQEDPEQKGIWKLDATGKRIQKSDSKVKLYRLEIKIDNIITIIKSRYYRQIASDQPQLISRFDQDPPQFDDETLEARRLNLVEDKHLDFLPSVPSEQVSNSKIEAVVVMDFNKGLVTKNLLEKLSQKINLINKNKNDTTCQWFIDSKNPNIFKELPEEIKINILTINRQEAYELAKSCSEEKTELAPILKGKQPTNELLSILQKISEKFTRVQKIVVKLDNEGACLHQISQDTDIHIPDTFLRQPEKPLKSAGIAAGDFFNASLFLSCLDDNEARDYTRNYSSFDDYILHKACKTAAKWLKLNEQYWAEKLFHTTCKSDIVQANYFNLSILDFPEEAKEKVQKEINKQSKNWDQKDEFNLKHRRDRFDHNFDYTKIINNTNPTITVSNAKGFLGGFASTDLVLRKNIIDFKDYINKYAKTKGKTRPLNCLIVAQPGSGKSFFVEQIADATNCKIVEVNCSQVLSPKDLLEGIAKLQNVKDKTPLLFLDEVDTGNGEYYPNLLAPLWDAKVSVNGQDREWNKRFITILVASNADTTDDFINQLSTGKTPKSLDLLSRLNGPRLNLSEQLEQLESEKLESVSEPEKQIKLKLNREIRTSRVYLTIDILSRYHDTARIIQRGFLDLVYCAPKFNPRAVENFIVSLPEPVDGIVRLKDIKNNRLKELAINLGYIFSKNLDELKKRETNIPDEKIIEMKKQTEETKKHFESIGYKIDSDSDNDINFENLKLDKINLKIHD